MNNKDKWFINQIPFMILHWFVPSQSIGIEKLCERLINVNEFLNL